MINQAEAVWLKLEKSNIEDAWYDRLKDLAINFALEIHENDGDRASSWAHDRYIMRNGPGRQNLLAAWLGVVAKSSSRTSSVEAAAFILSSGLKFFSTSSNAVRLEILGVLRISVRLGMLEPCLVVPYIEIAENSPSECEKESGRELAAAALFAHTHLMGPSKYLGFCQAKESLNCKQCPWYCLSACQKIGDSCRNGLFHRLYVTRSLLLENRLPACHDVKFPPKCSCGSCLVRKYVSDVLRNAFFISLQGHLDRTRVALAYDVIELGILDPSLREFCGIFLGGILKPVYTLAEQAANHQRLLAKMIPTIRLLRGVQNFWNVRPGEVSDIILALCSILDKWTNCSQLEWVDILMEVHKTLTAFLDIIFLKDPSNALVPSALASHIGPFFAENGPLQYDDRVLMDILRIWCTAIQVCPQSWGNNFTPIDVRLLEAACLILEADEIDIRVLSSCLAAVTTALACDDQLRWPSLSEMLTRQYLAATRSWRWQLREHALSRMSKIWMQVGGGGELSEIFKDELTHFIKNSVNDLDYQVRRQLFEDLGEFIRQELVSRDNLRGFLLKGLGDVHYEVRRAALGCALQNTSVAATLSNDLFFALAEDDDVDTRIMLFRLLQKFDKQGIEWLKSGPCRIILADILKSESSKLVLSYGVRLLPESSGTFGCVAVKDENPLESEYYALMGIDLDEWTSCTHDCE